MLNTENKRKKKECPNQLPSIGAVPPRQASCLYCLTTGPGLQSPGLCAKG